MSCHVPPDAGTGRWSDCQKPYSLPAKRPAVRGPKHMNRLDQWQVETGRNMWKQSRGTELVCEMTMIKQCGKHTEYRHLVCVWDIETMLVPVVPLLSIQFPWGSTLKLVRFVQIMSGIDDHCGCHCWVVQGSPPWPWVICVRPFSLRHGLEVMDVGLMEAGGPWFPTVSATCAAPVTERFQGMTNSVDQTSRGNK